MGSSPQLKYQRHSIVLLGNFNPKIFQPAWFEAEKLIRVQEKKEANVEVIHSDVAIFSLEWLRLEVIPERFHVAVTQEPYYEVVRDLVLGTFSLLRHTPINRLGLNWDVDYQMESEDVWHEAGHRLAPKELWSDILEKPGMNSLTMKGLRTDGFNGSLNVKIEPSRRAHPGLSMNINDHFETNAKEPMGSNEIMEILKSVWSNSYERSKFIFESLLKRLL